MYLQIFSCRVRQDQPRASLHPGAHRAPEMAGRTGVRAGNPRPDGRRSRRRAWQGASARVAHLGHVVRDPTPASAVRASSRFAGGRGGGRRRGRRSPLLRVDRAQKLDEVNGNHDYVNTPSLDGCPIQSPDGRSLYMASDRLGGHGGGACPSHPARLPFRATSTSACSKEAPSAPRLADRAERRGGERHPAERPPTWCSRRRSRAGGAPRSPSRSSVRSQLTGACLLCTMQLAPTANERGA